MSRNEFQKEAMSHVFGARNMAVSPVTNEKFPSHVTIVYFGPMVTFLIYGQLMPPVTVSNIRKAPIAVSNIRNGSVALSILGVHIHTEAFSTIAYLYLRQQV